MLTLVGNIAALAGLLVCGGAGGARVLGFYQVSGYSTMTLFQVGTGLMVLACLCKLQGLQTRLR